MSLHMLPGTLALRRRFETAGEAAAEPDSAAAAGNETCFTQLRHNFLSL